MMMELRSDEIMNKKTNKRVKICEQNMIEELKAEIMCGICLHKINAPKALVCMHTFCLDCLAFVRQKDEVITCPQCRIRTKVRNGDVKLLPTAFFVNRIGDIVSRYLKQMQTESLCTRSQQENHVICNQIFQGNLSCCDNACMKCHFHNHHGLQCQKVEEVTIVTQSQVNDREPHAEKNIGESQGSKRQSLIHTSLSSKQEANSMFKKPASVSFKPSQDLKFDVFLSKTVPGGSSQLVDSVRGNV